VPLGEAVKILLDTNIVINREAATVVDEDIGIPYYLSGSIISTISNVSTLN